MNIKFYGGPYHGLYRDIPNIPERISVLAPRYITVEDLIDPSPNGGKVEVAYYDRMRVSENGKRSTVYVFAGLRDWM